MESAWIEGSTLKAFMPALILGLDAFEPLWEREGARVEDGVIAIELSMLPNRENIIRVGRGSARKNEVKYYLVDREKAEIRQLRTVSRRIPYFNLWVDCIIHDGRISMCFKQERGTLVRMGNVY